MSTKLIAAMLGAIALSSCEKHDVTLHFRAEDGHQFTPEERRVIQTIADATALEVRGHLPTLPQALVLHVHTGTVVIAETGETASAWPPDTVYWIVDPKRAGGIPATAQRELRRTLFHEFHHLVRDASIKRKTLLDAAVSEGLATAFERDVAGAPAPWGRYPDDVAAWAAELLALPESAPHPHWLFRHPDGRRWIGFKVGTYWADRARRASGKSHAELVSIPTDEALRLGR